MEAITIVNRTSTIEKRSLQLFTKMILATSAATTLSIQWVSNSILYIIMTNNSLFCWF